MFCVRTTCIAATLGMAAAVAQPAVHFTVATDGKDPNPGTAAAPFATLEQARDAIRALKTAGSLPEGGAEVTVRGGTYERKTGFALTTEDSGTETAPIVYRATPGEEVRLVGGRMLAADAFRPVSDPTVLGTMSPEANGNVVVADLGALGVPASPPCPDKFRGPVPVPEVFVNDQRMSLARWPKEGWATVAKIIDTGSCPRKGDNTGEPGIIEYSGDRPKRWSVERGVWLLGYWCFDWYEEVLQVGAIDTKTRQMTFKKPHHYSVRQGNPSPRRYCALNLLEELDQPGEYYVDVKANLLYLWPPSKLEGARISISLLKDPVLSLTEASHVTVRGFTIEATQGNGIVVNGGFSDSIEACDVRNIRKGGVIISGGTGHRVEACDIHETGTGGLRLTGGNRKTLTPAGHQAINNHIWQFSRHQLTYANGIMLSGVGNRAAHNLIHDAPHQGVGVSGNDHLFEYNVVHHICTETDDCGAFYKGRNPSCRGNIVRYN
ncbi:MAG: right-handed parallel beta-helix repeat-containing protein, partial [Lentisphaerae bacterium]|nr:right-handed parallel beta-helix repeat-containing protein [Lentisphaerota bacterium]